jgi:hypothetical protein
LDISLTNHKCITDEKTNKITIWLRTRNYRGYGETVDFCGSGARVIISARWVRHLPRVEKTDKPRKTLFFTQYVKCSHSYALFDCVCSLMTKIHLCYYYFLFKYIYFYQNNYYESTIGKNFMFLPWCKNSSMKESI